MKKTILFALLFVLSLTIKAQTTEAFEKEQFLKERDSLNYRILYPENFTKDKAYPVILFLHGAGERGKDNEAQLTHGSSLFLEKRKEFPAIVIFPQAPKEDYWAHVDINRDSVPTEFNFKSSGAPTKSLGLVMALMDSIVKEGFVDSEKIYVGGLSMGAMGTYELLSRKPEMFSAAFAICGGANPAIVKNYKDGLNIWIFHGEKDEVVLPKYSKQMAREINSMGGNAKLSLYPEDNHNSWDSAFAEPYLLPWLFKH